MLEALDTLAREKKGPRGVLARRLLERVKAGATLAEAMAGSSEIPEEHAAILEAGERSGTLERCLARIVERLDRRKQLLSQFLPRIAYPAGTLVMAVVLLPLYLLFLGNGQTYLLIQLGFFGPLSLVALFIWRGPAFFDRHASRRRSFERFVLGVPFLGRIVTELVIGKASGLLGILLESGLSLRDALPIASKTVRWRLIADGFRSLEPGICAGKTLSEALQEFPAFAAQPSWIARIAVGEKTGGLDRSFSDLGESLEDGARARLERGLRFLPYIIVPLVGALVLVQALKVMKNLYGGL